jgi:hypothetical protein
MRYMYDSTNVQELPTNAQLVGVYANGDYFATPAQLQAHCPTSIPVWIDVNGSDPGAYVLDVEQFDATPQQAPGWIKAGSHNGRRPTIYCSRDTVAAVYSACSAEGLSSPEDYDMWIATLDGTTTWTNPLTGQQDQELSTVPGVVAVQYEPGSAYDISYVYDAYWPEYPPAPTPPKPAPTLTRLSIEAFYSDGTSKVLSNIDL